MKHALIIAGEASGDLHGANLVREARKQEPSIRFSGVGSRHMREAGVDLLADASAISVVGITEVLANLGSIYRVFAALKRFLRTERPDLLILIDFPDFNIMVGKAAKKLGIPILYYISPQVWAWRKGRIRTIAGLVKTMIVVFPFEVELYRSAGVDVRFVGHPLADVVHSSYTVGEARRLNGLDPGKRTIALLPGSRRSEIDRLLPDILGAARMLKKRYSDLQFVIPVAPTLDTALIGGYIDTSGVQVRIVRGRVYDVLRTADAAIVASGTATLETGLMTVPMVIVYRVSKTSYHLVKLLADAKYIGLVNIIANDGIVPELVQHEVTAGNIAAAVTAILSDPSVYRKMKEDLNTLKTNLGNPGASARAASVVLEMMH